MYLYVVDDQLINIKNMVCPRCISSVEDSLNKLGIGFNKIELGVVHLKKPIPQDQREELNKELGKLGFEILNSDKSATISRIKDLIIQQIHHSKEPLFVNYSTYLSEKLNHDYSGLSKLFSSVEGITIEKFILKQRVEKVKELIIYGQNSLSEIAFKMNYSSVAHLSSQFKKETGMTPSEFKGLSHPKRIGLDSV